MNNVKQYLALILTVCSVLTAGCGQSEQAANKEGNEMKQTNIEHYTAESSVYDVMSDPAFGHFGRLLLPAEEYYWSGGYTRQHSFDLV